MGDEVLRNGRYRVVGTLGEGARRGRRSTRSTRRRAQRVAIKRFTVRGATSWKDVELAEREARCSSRCRTRRCPLTSSTSRRDGALYLVMEKIEGREPRGAASAGRRALREDVVRFLRDASDGARLPARALAAGHPPRPQAEERHPTAGRLVRARRLRRGARSAEARGRQHGRRHVRVHGARAVPGARAARVGRVRGRRDRAAAAHGPRTRDSCRTGGSPSTSGRRSGSRDRCFATCSRRCSIRIRIGALRSSLRC